MKRAILLAALLLFFVLLLASKAHAQQHHRHGKHMHSPYDTASVETVHGTVARIDSIASPRGHTGIHLMLETGDKTLEVHLGPSWFLANQDQHLQIGDELEVTGSRVTMHDDPALLARTVRRGEHTLVLRDEDGFPVWRGWRRGGMKSSDS